MERKIIECPLKDSVMGVPDDIAMHLATRHKWAPWEATEWLRKEIEVDA